MIKSIENLVFEGGGVKGVAYAGALEYLESKQLLNNLKGVAGTSAGAITACMMSVGYSGSQIGTIVSGMSLSAFEDHEWIGRTFEHYGMHPGDAFLAWLRQQIAASPKGLTEDATFNDLHAKGCLDLHVFASDIYDQSIREFSYETSPNVVVAEAVRASMSIPLFFNAWQFTNNNPDDHLYVDGGMVYNYPIGAFDAKGAVNEHTLGFRLEDLHDQSVVNKFGYGHWVEYVKMTFETLMSAQTIIFNRDTDQFDRSIVIDDLGVSATNFNIDDATKQRLVQSGRDAAKSYFEPNPA
ncbi:MAG: patatin-like phospholipase family protein [Bacteroidota bacterium]